MHAVRLLPLAVLAVIAFPAPSSALRVLAATNDLGALAAAVGGPFVEVDVVARPDRDPHALEVRPSTMRKAARVDLYLEVGLSLDPWSADIVRGSRNRDVRVIRCSDAVEPREVPEGRVDASLGDVHPEGNPHYWLDPRNGVAVAHLLAREFSAAAPEHGAEFADRAAAFDDEVARRLPEWSARLRGATFVEYHRTWGYLAGRFGMVIVGRVEPLPGIPPSARHLAELSDVLRSDPTLAVVHDTYHPASPLRFLEREANARVVTLSASCAEPTPEAYLELFDRAARALGTPAEKGTKK